MAHPSPDTGSLSARLSRLRAGQERAVAPGMAPIPPLAGNWPQGCQAFPASTAQARLWFLHQLQPGLTAYHLPALWRLRGALDVPALAQALSALIARHPTLRTSFRLQGSEVLQILHPPAPVPLEAEPLGDRDAAAVIEAWQHEDASTPFDLGSGLLLRARLLAVSDAEHWLLITHHHIASDGWSLSVLARDLSAFYNALRHGASPRLAPLPVHYQDYAAWQRQRLSGDRLQALRDYWLPQLTGLQPLTLPADHPRPATPSHQGGRVCFRIAPERLAAFEALCRSEGATLQMGWLALVAFLLHGYSGQDEVVIGVPIWGRNHPDLEPLVGFFINTLPIRIRFDAQQSFRQLLGQIRTLSIAAYDHQELPFEQMVEALRLPRDPSRNPLVQVMLQLVELPDTTLDGLDGLEVELIPASHESSKLDLSFTLRRSPDQGLEGAIIYATDLFRRERIERLRSHLLTLLSSALAAAEAPAASLRCLPDAERSLIDSWQHGPAIEGALMEVHRLFEQQVERTPEAIALIFEDRQLSYRELNARANQLAHQLIARGVGPEVIVALGLQRSIELVVALIAVLKAGGAVLPLDPAWPDSRVRLALETARCRHLIGDGRAAAWCGGPEGLVRIDPAIPGDAADAERNPALDPERLDRLAYVMFTSGSTGVPKGIGVDHRMLAHKCLSVCQAWELTGSESVLGLSSFGFDISLREVLFPLTRGCRSVLVSEDSRRSPAALEALVRRWGISRIQATPSQWLSWIAHGLDAIRGSRLIAIGEPLPAATAARLCRQPETSLLHLYGTTEAPGSTSILYTEPDAEAPIVIGRPLHGVVVRILNRSLGLCPIGIPGELHIGGSGLARGYLHDPDRTAATFIRDPFSADPTARLTRTGDLASWNPDGTLSLHGRIDAQIKLRGVRIEPGEIEAQLLAHPAVIQALVVLRQDDPANPRLIAYWVPAQAAAGATPSADQLRAFLAERLPEVMVPSAFVLLEALPLTVNGKRDGQALPAPSFAGQQANRLAPSTDLERQLHALWVEVLGHSDFGITDNFFAIGGHSLAAARVLSRLEQLIGCAPTLVAFFQTPTISGQLPMLRASLSDRVARLRQHQSATPSGSIPAAAALDGDWGAGCQAFPASTAQARLWFLHQLQPGLTAYHLPALWRLRGALDVPALAQALSALIARHPTLRTSFRLQGSEVLQILHPPAPVPLEAEPLGDRDVAAVIEAWQHEDASMPFDLGSGLLLRARLLAVSDAEHWLLITHHHIASDGWSRSVLDRDLSALYNALRHGASPRLAPLPVHYQDYAVWQRQRLSGERLKALLDYWIPQLSDLEPLALPTDHPRPATPSHQGAQLSFRIAAARLAPLEDLCRSEGATLQMGLLALVATLLHRHSRQDDLAIGIPIWGRNHPDLEALIGYFINTLAIRTRFSLDLSFRQLLGQIRASSTAAYDHQDLPFEQIVEALNLARDTSRNPLVQVMLQLVELPPVSLSALDGLEVDGLATRGHAAKLDLSFKFQRIPDQGLEATITYATDLFAPDRIERLACHLQHLLASVLQSPDAAAASQAILPDSERALITAWQHGPRIEAPQWCVHQLFEQQVQRSPEATALIFEDQQLTYRELNARANQLAEQLIALGVGTDVIVAVCLERSLELIIAILAILKAGGAYLPIDASWPPARIEAMTLTASSFQITRAESAAALQITAGDGVSSVMFEPFRVSQSDRNPEANVPMQAAAIVIYTSGSTGTPKGVVIEHAALSGRIQQLTQRLAIGETSRVIANASIAFDASAREIFTTLSCGAMLLLTSQSDRQDLRQLATRARAFGCTHLSATPAAWEQLVSLLSPTGVRHLYSGGDKLGLSTQAGLLALQPRQLLSAYGPTEATICCAINDIRLPDQPPGLGRPLAGDRFLILDGSGQLCPIGVPGELHIGGAGLARGYLDNPELTAERFIADPFSADPAARLYRSGDLVSWNADGSLRFHGRLDHQIKLRGFRIEPGDIEANLRLHPAVAQVAVILRRDAPADPRLIAYWVPRPGEGAAASADQLRSFLAQRLPDYMVPAAFLQLAALPLTTSGKLDRRALPVPSFAAAGDQRVAPGTDRERQLHALWVEVLGHSDFGITDNFFVIGGHSLAAARLLARVAQALGTAPPLAALFRSPTIAGLAALLAPSAGSGRVGSPAQAIPRAQPLSLDL